MASNVIFRCGGFAFILLALHVVSLVTPSWFVIFYNGKALARAGMFTICFEEGGLCVPYYDHMFQQKTVHYGYLSYVLLNFFGCVFNLTVLGRCISHACWTSAQRQSSLISKYAALWFPATICLIASVVWFSISLMTTKDRLSPISSISSISVDPGYSFYLACVTAAAYLITAIVIRFYVRRLAASETPNVTGTPQVIVMQTGN